MDGDASVQEYWCSTKVDDIGEHIQGNWGGCSEECPGVEYEGHKETLCDTEETGILCSFPFLHEGYRYFGCLKTKGEQYWCPVEDEVNGVKKYNCSDSCPTDYKLATVRLSPKIIIEKLRKHPKVQSKIERNGDCDEVLGTHNLTNVRNLISCFIFSSNLGLS